MPSIQKIVLALAFVTSAFAAQISDGQIQQPTSVVTPVPVTVTPPVKQITDGQIQQVTANSAPKPTVNATTVTTPSAPAATFTGAASLMGYSEDLVAVAIGAAAVFAVL